MHQGDFNLSLLGTSYLTLREIKPQLVAAATESGDGEVLIAY
jgi:hypothetical protein